MEKFDKYGFPTVYPTEVLNNLRKQCCLSSEEFHQLHLCFDAASNLYATITLKELYVLCNRYIPSVSESQFLNAAEIIAHERGNHYAIVRREIFNKELPPGGHMDCELIAEHLYAVGDEYYYALKKQQAGKERYAPEWVEFVKYADQFYLERNAQWQDMVSYLESTQRKLHCPPEEITAEFCLHLRTEDDFQFVINEGQRLGVRFKNQQDFQHFLGYLLKLSHNTRRYCHCGHTPAELGLPAISAEDACRTFSYDNDYIDPLEIMGQLLRSQCYPPATSKPSRNGPCPCGSGKKYKRCCGKNE